MPGQTRAIYTYDEVDSEALPVAERFALWRKTGRLPMAAEPADDDGEPAVSYSCPQAERALRTLHRPHSKPDET